MAVDLERPDLRQADWNHEAAEAAADTRRISAHVQLGEAIEAQAARWADDESHVQTGRGDPAGHCGEAWSLRETSAQAG